MDHLPPVSSPYQPISIPYLGGPPYDNLDIEGYPARRFGHAYQVSALQQGDLQGRTELETAQFLQTWLYFGMLYEAYRLSDDHLVNYRDFVRVDEAGKEWITTACLPELFRVWKERIDGISKGSEEYERYYGRFRKAMVVACGVFRDLMGRISDENSPTFLSHEILLSIQILGAAIDIGVTEVCGESHEYTWRIVPRSVWLEKRMVGQGWCPCVVEQIQIPDRTFLYYASLLGPPAQGMDHSECKAGARACIAANVKDGAKYVSKHVVEGCECDFVVIDTGTGSAVASSISRGEIPVIKMSGDHEHGNVNVAIASWSAENPVPYVALSHVWSDGLGDPVGNRLPRCQIQRLAKLLRAIPQYPEDSESNGSTLPTPTSESDPHPDCYFWMDTLCISKDALLRQRAITRMSEVYSSASKVLVITSELMKHPTINRSYTEIFTRISCSIWLRRLWTLQEATLNRNVLFQFSDRAVYTSFRSSLQALQNRDNTQNPWDLVAWECKRFNFLTKYHSVHVPYASQMRGVWGSIDHRTTSRGGDEPLCLAILLGLDVEEIQKDPDAHTVKKFWRLHQARGVAAQVLFIPGPKLQEEGLHWAPSDLMDLKIVGGDSAHADVTPRGLCGQWPGVMLEKVETPQNFVIPFEVDGVNFYIRQNLVRNPNSLEELRLHTRRQLALLLLIVRRADHDAMDGFEAGLGALVEVRSEGEENHVTYLRLVSIFQKDGFADRHPNVPWKSEEIAEKGARPVQGVFLGAQQKWCVA